ncbi:formylglycine-generating enzyme family protein [Aeromonas bestiarum]|uniref:Formylglycine-generating enzyme family protein n=1 Tax=Aeromonas bestiarum TaxID=105751 RepID=A0AAW7I6E0_9GAMM|nr:SUMF1/EgtB/PvdO family nonheme iron enzyme [Aeromonas bestiarum]MDM5142844.1 formylglycine-generating enzyme family protein [Aeromonas bestiarum]
MNSKKTLSQLIIMGCALSSGSAFAEPWPEKNYNPKPDAEDVILPMPCEGSMAFRRVQVPVSGPLEDLPIQVGQDSGDWGFVEHTHPAFIAGSFTQSAKEQGRYYLMAKYELTQLQYQALTADTCPTPSKKLSLPVSAISWFDGVAATDKYNLWLRQHAADQIPKEDGKAGFVRLPTEIEWEFAARGGLKVNSAEFRDIRYPMNDLKEHEWFAGAQSANGRLQLVGLLAPNPLGLHDMLGNVDEMMFEPFYLNKLDRQHGQAGGYVVRGGNYLTEQAALRSAARKEVSYYDDDRHFTSKSTGLRLVLVSPTMTSTKRVKSIESSWWQLGANKPAGEVSDKKDAVSELNTLASGVDDEALKQKLKNLEGQLRASNQKQQEERAQSIRASLNLGAFLCTKLQDDGKFLDFLSSNYELLCSDKADQNCAARKTKLDEQKERLSQLTGYYASGLVESASIYGEGPIKEQVSVFNQMLTINKKLNGLRPFLATHWANQQRYLQNGKIDAVMWLENCKKLQ